MNRPLSTASLSGAEFGTTSAGTSWLGRLGAKPWPELAILVLAFLIRVWRLSYHSVWFDEAVSLQWARSDPSYIWQVTFPLVQDKHPPLYYLALHYWQELLAPFGLATNDAALRLSGSILGLLTVAGIMKLAGHLAQRRIALVAGIVVALAPILVWYSQELRMFQPATTAIVWSACGVTCAWTQVGRARRYLWWLVFVISLVAALYSYLFSAFVLPSAGLTVLLFAYRRRSLRFLIEGFAALVFVTSVFLPLANNAWMVNANESTPGNAFANIAENTYRIVKNFTVWRAAWPSPLVRAAVLFYAALALLGLAVPYAESADRNRRGKLDLDQIVLTIWLLVPFLTANLMLSRSGSIFDEDRYLLFLAPFLLWAVARGVVTLSYRSQLAGWIGGGASVVPLLIALPTLWSPAMARENWRAAADVIWQHAHDSPGLPEAVIAHVDYTHEPLEWYLRQEASFDELPVFFPFGGTLRADDIQDVIAPPLQGLVDFGTQTAWLTQSHLEGVDDDHLVEQWFASRFPVVTEQFPAGIKLSAYMLKYRYPQLPMLSERAHHPDVELAPGVVLAACEVLPKSTEASDDQLHPPSGWVNVRLWWRADDEIESDLVTSAKIVGPDGVWGDRLHRRGELMDFWPTTLWQHGEYVREELDINLNPVTPAGTYQVEIGLVESVTGEEMGAVSCGEIEIN